MTVALVGEVPAVKSVTAICTLLGGDNVMPLLVTVRFILLTPRGQVKVGLAPVAVPQSPVQFKVRGHAFGSEEPVPFNVTLAPLRAVPLRVWLGPALAVGIVRLAAARASNRPKPKTLFGTGLPRETAVFVKRLRRVVRPSTGARAPVGPDNKQGEACSNSAATPAA